MTEQQVVDLMLSSKTEEEWNQNCDTVKRAFPNRGRPDYPPFWFKAIILSGILTKKSQEFEVK